MIACKECGSDMRYLIPPYDLYCPNCSVLTGPGGAPIPGSPTPEERQRKRDEWKAREVKL